MHLQVALQHLVYVEQTAKQIRREVAAKEKAIAEARSERLAAGEGPFQGESPCLPLQQPVSFCSTHLISLDQYVKLHSDGMVRNYSSTMEQNSCITEHGRLNCNHMRLLCMIDI